MLRSISMLKTLIVCPIFIAVMGIQCYVCGEISMNGQCNETYKGIVTECPYYDQSCVATIGEFGDVSGKSIGSLVIGLGCKSRKPFKIRDYPQVRDDM